MNYTKKGRGIGILADTATNISSSDSVTFDLGSVYVGYGGTVVLITADDETVTFGNVQAGSVVPVLAKKILATGTTATGFVILE